MRQAGAVHLANDLVRVLDLSWLGEPSDPQSPAGIVAKLGYNLFITKGIEPTFWETIRLTLRDEGTKEFVHLVGTLLVAALLLWLGLGKDKSK
jgi:hypothetical protein